MTSNQTIVPHGVARIWRERTRSENADEYTSYMYENGVKKLEALGAKSVQFFRENLDSHSEFMGITLWDSLEAMTGWAGTDPRKIRHLERDPELLMELPESV